MNSSSESIKWRDMTLRNKIQYFLSNITVEPILLCYVTPLALGQLAIQNLFLEKACRVKLGYSNEVCSALAARETQNYTLEETTVQQVVANMYMWKSFPHLIPGFVVIFLGSWSDRKRRRKPLMLMALFAELMCALCGMFCAYFFYEVSLEMTVFLDAFFPFLLGGGMTMSIAIFSYIADITPEKSRTFRIGIVNIFYSVGNPLGTALSGISYKAIGFQGVFGVSAVIFVIGIVYCLLRIKALMTNDFHENSNLDKQIHNKTSALKENIYLCGNLKAICELSHIKDTFSVVFKPRSHNLRLRLILLLLALYMIDGPGFGEYTMFYLFMRIRFNWDEVQYSFFATYISIIYIIGTAISVGLLSHLLQFEDALIGIISCISRILAGFMYAFAHAEWHIFLAPVFDIVSGANSIVMKSMTSKLVPPEELGKVYSLFGAFGSTIPLLYGPMFAFIYANTVDTMPGAFFIVGCFLITPAALIFGWLYQQSKTDRLRTTASKKMSSQEEDINEHVISIINVT